MYKCEIKAIEYNQYKNHEFSTTGYIFCNFGELMELYDLPKDLDHKINFIWTLGLFEEESVLKDSKITIFPHKLKLKRVFFIYDWDSVIKPEEIVSSNVPISWRIGTTKRGNWLEDFKDFHITLQIKLWNLRNDE
jgi:hypothetical protein